MATIPSVFDLQSIPESVEGYLYKQGGMGLFKSWKRRYFVLTLDEHLLRYFDQDPSITKSSIQPLGSIDMINAEIVALSLVDGERKFCFGITPFGFDRQYLLSAESAEERLKWVSCLLPARAPSSHKISIKSQEGWMYKIGDFFKTWKKRFFSLDKLKNQLLYYEDIKKDVLLGTIDLYRAVVISLPFSEYQRDYCFSLQPYGKSRVYGFSCFSFQSKMIWLTAIAPLEVFDPNIDRPPTYGSYLLKQGVHVEFWKRRYFEFHSYRHTMVYFSDIDSRAVPLGCFSTKNATLFKFDDGSMDFDFCFGIRPIDSDRVYLLAAETKEIMKNWFAALKKDVIVSSDSQRFTLTSLRAGHAPSVLIVPHEIDTIVKILSHRESYQSFYTFLQGEYAVENLHFFTEVQNFVQLARELLLSKVPNLLEILRNRAIEIYQIHIARGAQLEVNLPQSMVKVIAKQLQLEQSASALSLQSSIHVPAVTLDYETLVHIYDDAQNEIVKLLSSGSYQRFLKSDIYQELFSKWKMKEGFYS